MVCVGGGTGEMWKVAGVKCVQDIATLVCVVLSHFWVSESVTIWTVACTGSLCHGLLRAKICWSGYGF